MIRAKELLFVGFILTALILALTFPAILFLKTQVIGDGGDNLQFLSFQYIGNMLFTNGNFPFGHTSFWRFPVGISFQSSYDSTLLILLGLFFYSFLKNPVVVYNLSLLLLFFAHTCISYLIFRRFFQPLIAFIGTLIYGFSFYTLARLLGHPNLLLSASIPLFFFSLFRIYEHEGKEKRDFFLFTGATLLVAFASLQYPLLILGSLPFLLLLLYLFFPIFLKQMATIFWQKRIYVGAALTAIVLIFSVFHGSKLLDTVTGNLQLPSPHISSVPTINFFVPNLYTRTASRIITNTSERAIESALFLGFVEIALFIAALIFVKPSRFKWFLLSTTGVFFLLACGVQTFASMLWPYQYLFPIFPYRGIIEPGRFFVLFYFGITFLILTLLSKVKHRAILFVLCALLLIERLPVNFPLRDVPPNDYAMKVIQTSYSTAVLDLPVFVDWWNGPLYDFYSILYQKPVVNGYIHWSGDTPNTKSFLSNFSDFMCSPYMTIPQGETQDAEKKRPEIIALLKANNIHTVVIHKDLLFAQCQRARLYSLTLGQDLTQWNILYEDDAILVLWLR